MEQSEEQAKSCKEEKIKAYKGFDENLKCRGFQYEVGNSYEQSGVIKACEKGFHACEYPFDVFGYYAPFNSRYCEVEQSGETDRKSNDSKVASSKIHISAEIGIRGLVEGAVKFIFDRVNWKDAKESNTGYQSAATNTGDRSAATNTGYQSAATNTGYQSAATNTGDQSAATNTGYQSAAEVGGKESIAIVTGKDSKAKGALGCWLVLTERDKDWHILGVKSVKVDGETIKSDTWYKLVNGEIIEVK